MDLLLNFIDEDAEGLDSIRVDGDDQQNRPYIDFVGGANVTITPSDDPLSGTMTLTFSANDTGAINFLDLADTPNAYTGTALNFVRVKNDESGLEFVTPATLAGQLSHTNLQNIGTNTHGQIDTHISASNNPHLTTLEQARSAGSGMTGAFTNLVPTATTKGLVLKSSDNSVVTNIFEVQGSTSAVEISFSATGGAVFNESANDADFRVEGVSNPNLIFADASTNRMGVGTATPSARLDVRLASGTDQAFNVSGYSGMSNNLLTFDVPFASTTTIYANGYFNYNYGTGVGNNEEVFSITRSGAQVLSVSNNTALGHKIGVNGGVHMQLSPVNNQNAIPTQKVTATAHTALAFGTEHNEVLWDFSATQQFGTGVIANQRAAYIRKPTYSAVGASTIGVAATVEIEGSPAAGTNMTIGSSYALRIASGNCRFEGFTAFGGAIDMESTVNMFGNLSIYNKDIVLTTATGTKMGTDPSQKLGLWGATPATQPPAYTPSNDSTLRSFDVATVTLTQLANVVATMYRDLALPGFFA